VIEVDFSKCVLPPYDHMKRGIKRLIERPRYGLFWEMRLMKTSTVISAASFLHQAGELDAVLVCCPAQVKDVWGHSDIGEVKKHAFVPSVYYELNGETEEYVDMLMQATKHELLFAGVSHELLRQEDAFGEFPRSNYLAKALAGKKVWVVYDEGAAFGNWKSLQNKSALDLNGRLKPVRKSLLDGTPIGNSPMEQYSKFLVLGRDVLGYNSFYHFRGVHGVMAPHTFKQYDQGKGEKVDRTVKKQVGFQRQEIIDRKVKEFCEYLEQKDCLDMPEKVWEKLPVRLGQKSWSRYCEMRDELVAELDSGILAVNNASVKVLRLAQMCAGFVGGVENEVTGQIETVELSSEACDSVMDWLHRRFAENVGFKCVIWCRWRPEIERLHARLTGKVKPLHCPVALSYGAKKTYDNELHPDSGYDGPFVLIAQPQSLRYGVNLSKAPVQLFMSKDYNLVTRAQALERVQSPKEKSKRDTTLCIDVAVIGPSGQRTITWDIDAALETKEQVARRTAGEWKRALLQ
jgi:hypothetical protein